MEAIWPFFSGQYCVHCRDRKLASQIRSWTGCVRNAVYYYPDGHIEEDVLIPARLLERARRLIESQTESKIGEKSPTVAQ